MNKLKIFACVWMSSLCLSSFANLPFYPITLPRDDAAHYSQVPYPIKNLTEWWYYNGHLVTTTGQQFGYYLAVFRVQKNILGIKWVVPFIQYQITDINQGKVVASQSMQFKPKNTSYATSALSIKLGDQFSLTKNDHQYVLKGQFQQKGQLTAFDMQLQPLLKPLLIGGKGLIPMGKNTNSYYYSITRLAPSGTLTVDGKTYEIDRKKSLSWMDHQWGDFGLSHATQWIWMSIQLDNGIDINLMKGVDPNTQKIVSGLINVLLPNGKSWYSQDFTVTPAVAKLGQYPLTYQIHVPALKLDITMHALAPNQYLNGYWEGINKAQATYQGHSVHGYGYTENTIRYRNASH